MHLRNIIVVVAFLLAVTTSWFGGRQSALSSIAAREMKSRTAPVVPVLPPKSGSSLSSDVGTVPADDQGLRAQLTGILGNVDRHARQDALRKLGALLGSVAPERGMALLSMITGLADKQEFAEALLREWGKKSASAALAACSALAAGELRATGMAAAISAWAESEPDKATAWAAAHLTGSARQTALAKAAEAWAQRDPQGAANWALQNASSIAGATVIKEVMNHWAAIDPKGGAEWCAQLPAGSFRDTAMEEVITEWADQFPSETAAWLAKQPDAAKLSALLANTWAKSDPKGAAAWVQALPAGQARSDAALDIAATWSAADPAQALSWIDTAIGDPAEKQTLTTAAVQSWAADEPASALIWSRQRNDTASSEAVLDQWAGAQPETLETFVQSQPKNVNVDAELSHLANGIADTRPSDAIANAMSIQDPTLQGQAIRRVYDYWRGRDAAAAQQWLATHPEMQSVVQPALKKRK